MKKKCSVCGKDFEGVATELLCKDCYSKPTEFIKADNGKLRWSLLPFRELEDVVKVLEMGARKYKADNWKKCDDTKRYEDALMRHLVAYMKGDKTDNESGLNHMSHIICNALFLSYFDKEEELKAENDELRAWD